MDSRPVTVHYIGGPHDGRVDQWSYRNIAALGGRINLPVPPPAPTIDAPPPLGPFRIHLDIATYVCRSRPVMDGSSGSVYADYTHG